MARDYKDSRNSQEPYKVVTDKGIVTVITMTQAA